jgi:MSHA biogenesis protein MshP
MFRSRQTGLGAIAAIMILVMLAGLAAFMASLSSSQQIGGSLDVQGSKAYSAAQSGVEWGLYQAITAASCAASTNLGAIDGMSVTVTCASSAVPEQGSSANFYSITATACNQPTGSTCPGATTNPLYVERRISALTEH